MSPSYSPPPSNKGHIHFIFLRTTSLLKLFFLDQGWLAPTPVLCSARSLALIILMRCGFYMLCGVVSWLRSVGFKTIETRLCIDLTRMHDVIGCMHKWLGMHRPCDLPKAFSLPFTTPILILLQHPTHPATFFYLPAPSSPSFFSSEVPSLMAPMHFPGLHLS